MSMRSWSFKRQLQVIGKHAAASPWVTKTEVVDLEGERNEQAHALIITKVSGEVEERIDLSVSYAGYWEVTKWRREDEYSPWIDSDPKPLLGFGGHLRYDADPRDVLQQLELTFISRP